MSDSITGFSGAVFDCDGILVDSEAPWIDLMAGYLTSMSASGLSPEDLRGLTADEAVARLQRIHEALGSPSDVQPPTAAEVDRAYSAALEHVAAPMPGAPELVASLSGTIPIAVASNGRGEDVRGLLERAGMLDFFDAIITIDDVDQGKPAPDPYLLAARRLGLSASTVVAFEDSPVGSQAAHTAGCTVIGVNNDPSIELAGEVRLRHFAQLRFDPRTRSLLIDIEH
ncbi:MULTISPECIES: HAD family hydrolase [unclassified Brevibacterium]|uniref:HAD family hydrolase n=1 Tax=unclassified Brevibacterium TaxID=2614124 RepID=UPI000C3DC1C4|nr:MULTISPECIES: HAD family phosphatase [unclassified Brevibacterium]SMX85528.1 haloacid dehalogenase superfamily, subfamily IA, variant 3 with third motif having DD or ED [Brevibacterium sp. 239c]